MELKDLLNIKNPIKLEDLLDINQINFKEIDEYNLYNLFGIEKISLDNGLEETDINLNVFLRVYFTNGDYLSICFYSLPFLVHCLLIQKENFVYSGHIIILNKIDKNSIFLGLKDFFQNNYSWLRKIISDPKFQAWGENKY